MLVGPASRVIEEDEKVYAEAAAAWSKALSEALAPSPTAITICLYGTVVTSPAAKMPGSEVSPRASTMISPVALHFAGQGTGDHLDVRQAVELALQHGVGAQLAVEFQQGHVGDDAGRASERRWRGSGSWP
ncbi:hypothetical protein RLJV_23660 [Pseudomonas aeruginosa]|nr:hypothetical protein RLJV_23660 [Pseudomonas aeruginosa]